MKKEKNSFDRTVEMFEEADAIMLSNFHDGIVCGEPLDSRTGRSWGMAMVSSIEEALECKYPKCCDPKDKELCEYLENNCKK